MYIFYLPFLIFIQVDVYFFYLSLVLNKIKCMYIKIIELNKIKCTYIEIIELSKIKCTYIKIIEFNKIKCTYILFY